VSLEKQPNPRSNSHISGPNVQHATVMRFPNDIGELNTITGARVDSDLSERSRVNVFLSSHAS